MGQQTTISRYQTKVWTTGTLTTVRLYETNVVSFFHDGILPFQVYHRDAVVLNSGGWRTVTTKSRMNQASNQYDLGYQVYQHNFQWFVRTRHDGILPFVDGMGFHA
jgi:hypothetical protein